MENKETIIITEHNRDGAKIWLEKADNGKYKVMTNKDYILQYCRFILNYLSEDSEDYDAVFSGKKVKLEAFDPSGGPYINVGNDIGGKKVVKIESNKDGIFLTLE